jgi:hypothetical protein
MAYDQSIAGRVSRLLSRRKIKYEAKSMMGGLCFMVAGKMCVGIEKDQLMARIGPDAYDRALKRKGCRPMDFTGRPMRGFVFIEPNGLKTAADFRFWMDLALAYNQTIKKSRL